jgi:hypothetical protein
MPYSGGVFSPVSNSWNPAVQATVINPTDWGSMLSDLATGLSTAVLKDGTQTLTANIPFGNFKITGLGVGSARTDSANLGQVQDGIVSDAGYTGGSSTVYTATLSPAITAYADKQCFRVIFNQACGATPTINFNAVGAKKLYRNINGVATQVTTGDILANFLTDLRYDTTLDGAAGAFWVVDLMAIPAASIGPDELSTAVITEPVNVSLSVSVAANALTIALKGQDGNDPSAANAVKVPFPNQTGGYDALSVTAATSLVVSSGSTLGTANGVLAKLWIVAFNDAGTFRLGIVNTQEASGIFPITPYNTYSATAEGGAGGADSAGVFYAGAAVTTKAICILGFMEVSEATAGTWATAPAKVVLYKLGMPLPGTVLQPRQVVKTDTFSTTSTTFTDITGLSRAITPTSATSRVRVQAVIHYGNNTANFAGSFVIDRSGTDIGIGDAAGSRERATAYTIAGATNGMGVIKVDYIDSPASAASLTYKMQMLVEGNTGYVNRSGLDTDSAVFGRPISTLTVEEIVA